MAFGPFVNTFTPHLAPPSRPKQARCSDIFPLFRVMRAILRRNPIYNGGIIIFTPLVRSRSRSPQEILHQIGKLHPVGHAQKQTPFTHYDFRISASEIGPSHGNRPNPAALRLQQKPLPVAIVSLAHAAQLPLE